MSDPGVTHSFLSFSSRARWRACPGSVRLSKGLPDKSGPSAAEGTLAHKVKEWAMGQNNGALNVDTLAVPEGVDLGGKTPDEWRKEMVSHARKYVEFVRALVQGHPDAIVLEEQKVDARSIHPMLFGTADTIIWIPSVRRLIVIDYKYGFRFVGVGTAEDTNPQLAAYGVAAAEKLAAGGFTVAEIVLAVYQPRAPLHDPASTLRIADAQAWLWAERAKLAKESAATERHDAPIVAGGHCRYCKAAMAGKCDAARKPVFAALNVAAGVTPLLDIPVDELLALYSARPAFKPFWEEVEARVEQLAKVGHARLVTKESQGRQMWADPKTAALTLLAIGRADLVQPVALSDALPNLPADMHATLVKRSKPSISIKVVDAPHVKEVAKMFDKYAKPT